MSTTTLIFKNGSTPHTTPESWLCQTARAFFSNINWDDHPPEVQELKLAATADSDSTSVSLLLTVRQFFSTVNWDGAAVTPNPTTSTLDQEQLPPGPTSLTLEDFSDLF